MPIDPDATVELLSIPAVAGMLDVCEETVRRLQHKRQLRHYRVGRKIRFLKSDVIEYLEKRCVEAIGS